MSGRSKWRKVGEWYGRGTGATRGTLQTTWRGADMVVVEILRASAIASAIL